MRDNLKLSDLLDSTLEDFIEEAKSMTLGELSTLFNLYLPQAFNSLKKINDDIVSRDTGGKDKKSRERAELFDTVAKKMKAIEDRSVIVNELIKERIRTTPLTQTK